MKRLFTYLLSFLFSYNALAFQLGGIFYSITSETTACVTFQKYQQKTENYSGNISIPASIDYQGKKYTITEVSNYAFYECSKLTSISLPETITKIGIGAFQRCYSLSSINIPSNVTSIGHEAFYACRNLSSIVLPNSITSIGHHAFCDAGLEYVKSEIKTPFDIDPWVFPTSSKNRTIEIPDGTKAIYKTKKGWLNNFNTIIDNGSFDLSITVGSNGFVTCGDTTIQSQTIEYTVIKNASVKLLLFPDNGYRIASVKVNNTDVTSSVNNNQYTISNITASMTVEVIFEAIPPTTYTLSITASGNGSVSYNGTTIRSKTTSFTANEGTSVSVSITPDNGYRVKSVKENNTDVTSYVSNGKYTINSISRDTNIEVEFEAIPPTTYTLSITASGNGSVSFNGTTIRSKTTSFTANEGTSVSISITPDNGYRVKSLKENNTDVTSYVSNGKYTINSISRDTNIEVEFEAIPPTAYTLSITASGNGSVSHNGTTIKNDTQSFTVNEGSSATVTFSPDSGYRIASVKVNNTDVTSSVTNNQYTISSISANTTLSVTFEAINGDIFTSKTIEGIDMVFKIISESEKTCEVYGYSETSGSKTLIHAAIDQDYTGELMVPEKANGYSVIGISDYAFYYTKASMIVLPFGCKYIGRQALAYSAIQEIGIPGTTISIGNNAFMHCRQLTSISIPSSMEHIGFGVFFGCSNLGAITFQKGNLKKIGGGAFQDCHSLQDITIPEGVESIGSEDSGTYFIYNCAKLKTLSLPQSLLEINENLIGKCPLIETITVNKEVPISVDNIMLVYPYDDPLINERATLLVPKDSKGLYQEANRWKDFKQIKEIGVEDYYNLSIVASGDGVAIYNNTEIRNTTKTFTVNDGSSATISFSPDNGNSLSSVKVNRTDVTSQVANYRYTINNIKANTTISATFVKDANAITVENVNYKVVSQSDKTINLATGDYGQVLTVPASVTSNDKTWKIVGIEQDALKGNTELAAVIWNPSIVFNAEISNPNLLLYVKDGAYAPTTIQNIVVNNTAEKIVLTEAANGNNFYCPQAFTARQISYTHHYSMQTGVEESRGWETIALPFDVQTITHENKGNIKAFANWKRADAEKPFWLYELTGSGFVEASNIKANTPYIISMPNHPRYDSEWLLKGTVTFAASNVTVNKTEDINKPTYSDRTFIPCFATKESDAGIYSLNVNNDFEKNTSGMTEGSKFVLNMRKVHPFEAYMTTTSASNRAIGIFDGMSTDIRTIENMDGQDENSYYDLQGRKTIAPTKKGVYIKNRKKVIIK